MFDNDITLNANAHVGVNAPILLSRVSGTRAFWTAPTLVNTTPLELDIQHGDLKRGKDQYVRSTFGLTRKELVSTNGSGLVQNSWRLINERPRDPSAISSLDNATQLGQLWSLLGITLFSGSNPTTALLKFFNREG